MAVVGASDRSGSAGAVLWRNLAGFTGEVVAVSASSPTVGGMPAYPSLRDVPGTVDLAVVAVPAAAAVDVVADAAAAGTRCCLVLAAGFAETGAEGGRLQQALVDTARQGGVLLAGPNCLGVQNLDIGLNASLAAGTGRGGGGISLVTHSGSYAMALHALSTDDGIGFACAYSAGNAADLADHEVLAYLAQHGGTRVVAAFVESLSNGRALLEVARRVTARVPVVVAAVGRTDAGARSAASHTAALATDRRVWHDVLAGAGVTVARTGLEMLDAAHVLATVPLPRGPRVAVVTNSGGTGTELADLLVEQGLVLPPLSAGLQHRLAALLPAYATTANPVDVTPVWSRYGDVYPAVVEALARSGEVDVVVPVLLHRAAEQPQVADGLARVRASLHDDGVAVPVVVCWVAAEAARRQLRRLHDANVPCVPWPERTARAVGHAVRAGAWRQQAGEPPPTDPPPAALPAGVRAGLLATEQFLRDHGLPLVPTARCATPADAVAAAASVDGPVVVKVAHPDLSHKSDVGGVRTGLHSPRDVADAAVTLLALAPGAHVLVQPQCQGVELVVGGLRDATFGPVVGVGLGGVLVELLDDVAFAAAPLGSGDLARLLDHPRLSRLLEGWRGAPPVDREALAAIVATVGGLLAAYPDVDSIDLNPVIAGATGLVAVDWRVTLRSASRVERSPLDSSRAAEVAADGTPLASTEVSPRPHEETP